VICCGGLGPTQDDITREAIAEVMGVQLRRDESMADVIRGMFTARGRLMSENNLRQADVPEGARVIPQTRGTAPGLICPVERGDGCGVVYAVPGVPHEMREMVGRAVIPDLQRRSGTTPSKRRATRRSRSSPRESRASRFGSRPRVPIRRPSACCSIRKRPPFGRCLAT
jgi:nicotinamide-nucleotide amidase